MTVPEVPLISNALTHINVYTACPKLQFLTYGAMNLWLMELVLHVFKSFIIYLVQSYMISNYGWENCWKEGFNKIC